MSRFVNINGIDVNVDSIKEVCPPTYVNEKGTVRFKDGTYCSAPSYTCQRIVGEDHVMYVFPCPENIVAVYDIDGELYEEDIFLLGLCADGYIKPISLQDGYFDVFDETSMDNFKGLYQKSKTNQELRPASRQILQIFGKSNE